MCCCARWPQDGAKMAPRRPKTAPDRRKMAQDGPQDGPRWPPRWPKIGPRGPKMAPRRPQDGPKRAVQSATNRGVENQKKSRANVWEVRNKCATGNPEVQKWRGKNSDFAWEVLQKLEIKRFQGKGLRRQSCGFVWEGCVKTVTTTKPLISRAIVLSRRNARHDHFVEAKCPWAGRGVSTIINIKNY